VRRASRLLLLAAAGTVATLLLAAAAVCLGSGCSSVGYYGQAVAGHVDLMNRARPVTEVLADTDTDAALRDRLKLAQQMRDFAVAELALPDNPSYRRYADLQRNAVVWNVVAAPELSLKLKTWCFPVLGCVGYRGYFDRAEADALAAQLKAEGWEVSVYGVPAYSTLGWSNGVGGDPLLNTFIRWPEGELARLIFHELAHQVVYVDDDTTFNESFATAVERLGGARWLAEHATPEAREAYAALDARRQDFRALTLRWRDKLKSVYDGPGSDDDKRRAKAALMQSLRSEYAALKRERWGGFAGYDGWFERANNAAFGVQAAYNELVGDFERLFVALGSDFTRFYAEVKLLAALPKDERRARLQSNP
jgi:predicted aminopeptidase